MKSPYLDYIRTISLKSIRDYILDNNITENDTILLNSDDFLNIALEYRQTYSEGIQYPYYLIRVMIKEDDYMKVPPGRIGIVKDDESRFEMDYKGYENELDTSYENETIYRCGWCGNIVDFDGVQFDQETRNFKIRILQKFQSTVNVIQVNGQCCNR